MLLKFIDNGCFQIQSIIKITAQVTQNDVPNSCSNILKKCAIKAFTLDIIVLRTNLAGRRYFDTIFFR